MSIAVAAGLGCTAAGLPGAAALRGLAAGRTVLASAGLASRVTGTRGLFAATVFAGAALGGAALAGAALGGATLARAPFTAADARARGAAGAAFRVTARDGFDATFFT